MTSLLRAAAIAALVAQVGSARVPAGVAGVWEGEIDDPGRPVVVTVDFGALTASFGGAMSVPVTLTAPDASAIEFRTRTLRFAGSMASSSRMQGLVDLSGRPTPFWLEQLPLLPRPANRVEAWRQDLDVVSSRFLRYDRSFTDRSRTAARKALEALKSSVPVQDDPHVIIELARIIASSGNAHTRLYLVRNRSELRRLPIRVWWFRNKLRIVGATADHRDLLGCRVMKINGIDAAAAARRVTGIKAGNESWQRYMSTYFLTSVDTLIATNVIGSEDDVSLALSCARRTAKVTLPPMPLVRSATPVEAWWDLAPSYPHPDGTFVSAMQSAPRPRYLKNVERNYWFEYVPADTVLYAQFNRAEEVADTPITQFVENLVTTLENRDVRKFVVDVRFNTGGNLYVATPVVDRLAPLLRARRIPVYILTGRATFSAGITLAAQWKQFAGATIVGERVGDGLDMWSEGGNLLLPNSRLTVHYGNAFHSYSRREYPERRPYYFDLGVDSLEPSIRIEPSWSDYISGNDPVYIAAIRHH